jgi:hypothetical protein
MMIAIALVGLVAAFLIHRQRSRTLKRELVNQEICVQAAYVNYMNAALAHDNARIDATSYLEKSGKDRRDVTEALSQDREPEDETFRPLWSANKKALAEEWTKKAIWELEWAQLRRLIQELQDMW